MHDGVGVSGVRSKIESRTLPRSSPVMTSFSLASGVVLTSRANCCGSRLALRLSRSGMAFLP
jgi:hypothetical protein